MPSPSKYWKSLTRAQNKSESVKKTGGFEQTAGFRQLCDNFTIIFTDSVEVVVEITYNESVFKYNNKGGM